MINKKNLWFLTLFSLVLVLSIYYVTMPNEVFNSDLINEENTNSSDDTNVSIETASVISVLKTEDDVAVMAEIDALKEKITDNEVSIEEKNAAFEELKLINKTSSKEETLESSIKNVCDCENFVKIDGDNIRVVLDSDDNSATTANEIMRLVQQDFTEKMYISVKFN